MDEHGQETTLRSELGIEVGLHQALASQRKGTLSMCHACSGVTTKRWGSSQPQRVQTHPKNSTRGGGEKPGCQPLLLTVGSGSRAEVRMLHIPTAVLCLQDLRNWTRQLKRNPVV